jgi:Ni2+-binding GTPase involved in maturation of urease and hydrogenase
MSVEVSGPPGGGKTAVVTALAINARLAEDEKNSTEVLIVGEFHDKNKISLTLQTQKVASRLTL